MKIYKARLILNYTMDDKWDTRFYFELQDKEYKLNEKTNEWTHIDGWIVNRIPNEMIVEQNGYDGLRVVQGFDRELNKNELNVLETEMRKMMVKELDVQRKRFLKEHGNKIKAVWEGISNEI